jgi:hypothetical protein
MPGPTQEFGLQAQDNRAFTAKNFTANELLPAKTPFTAARRRVNFCSVGLTLFLPTVLFVAIFGVLSFSLHYGHPGFCWFIVITALLLVGLLAVYALDYIRKHKADVQQEPNWIVFFTALCFVGWCLAVPLGLINFWSNTSPHFDLQVLNNYNNVDVGQLSGAAVMDAGHLTFQAGTYVDTSKAVGFKDGSTYCVAPISPPKTGVGPLLTYDFWAAGVDCCSGVAGDFHCGEANGKLLLGGATRILDSGNIAKFTLATEQAGSFFHFRVGHPIFLTTQEDPLRGGSVAMERALKFYCLVSLIVFGLNVFLVSVVLVMFARYT